MEHNIMRIKTLREAAGLRSGDLAEKMGVVPACVTNWERETALPRARQLPQLAEVLGCTVNDLFEQAMPTIEQHSTDSAENPCSGAADPAAEEQSFCEA